MGILGGKKNLSEASEREQYRHRHIDIDILDKRKEKKRKERRFYIPKNFEITFHKLEEILTREGKSVSEWIREQAEPYVRLHEPGNPQQTLPTIMKLGKAYRADSCAVCGGKPAYRAIQGKRIFLLCESDFEKKKGRLTGWKKFET